MCHIFKHCKLFLYKIKHGQSNSRLFKHLSGEKFSLSDVYILNFTPFTYSKEMFTNSYLHQFKNKSLTQELTLTIYFWITSTGLVKI